MGKFKRYLRQPNKATEDNPGKVIIKVFLAVEKKGHLSVRGNIVKTITINDAKVGDVYTAIEKALF